MEQGRNYKTSKEEEKLLSELMGEFTHIIQLSGKYFIQECDKKKIPGFIIASAIQNATMNEAIRVGRALSLQNGYSEAETMKILTEAVLRTIKCLRGQPGGFMSGEDILKATEEE